MSLPKFYLTAANRKSIVQGIAASHFGPVSLPPAPWDKPVDEPAMVLSHDEMTALQRLAEHGGWMASRLSNLPNSVNAQAARRLLMRGMVDVMHHKASRTRSYRINACGLRHTKRA